MKGKICILGLGNIGLPLACVLASSGYLVFGVDTDEKVVSQIGSKAFVSSEPNLQSLLQNVLEKGNLHVSTCPVPANIFIIAVPTFLNASYEPNISHVHEAILALKPYLQPGNLILIESTCPIGTTESISLDLLSNLANISIVYCPERVFPGNILHELIHNDRVVGGLDDHSTLRAAAFYETFVKGQVFTTDARTAEAVKIAENCYRDINIAFANELSMVADYMNLDVNRVIELANRHPRVKILSPGPGVGGHCISVNPWFLISSAPEYTKLVAQAREVNNRKTEWVLQKIKMAIRERRANGVACLGLTYKPNVSNTKASPALAIVEALEKEIEVYRVDPHVPNTVSLDKALDCSEIIVALVAHSEFLNIPKEKISGKKVLDFAGVFV